MREKGFALMTAGVCAVAVLGMLGLAVDLGRLFVIRGEMQTYTDSAALAGAVELDGTTAGITRARTAVTANLNRWNLGTSTFSGTQTDFAATAAGPWEPNPSPATGYMMVRVRTQGSASLYFLPVVVRRTSASVASRSIAGQLPKTTFMEGLFPFAPIAHNNGAADFGFTPGQVYTLRWPSNPRVGVNVCAGDDAAQWVAHAREGSSSERGYIEETSASIIRQAILDDYQTRPLSIGDTLLMTGGNKQTERDAIINRVGQDTDPTSATYTQYEAGGTGNGRRLVVAPVGSGYPDEKLLGFGLFFLLLPTQYDASGNRPFCAEYVGPYVEGSRHKGAGGPGAWVVRLVE